MTRSGVARCPSPEGKVTVPLPPAFEVELQTSASPEAPEEDSPDFAFIRCAFPSRPDARDSGKRKLSRCRVGPEGEFEKLSSGFASGGRDFPGFAV